MSKRKSALFLKWKCNYARCVTKDGEVTGESYCFGAPVRHRCVNGDWKDVCPFKKMIGDKFAMIYYGVSPTAWDHYLIWDLKQHMNSGMVIYIQEQEEKNMELPEYNCTNDCEDIILCEENEDDMDYNDSHSDKNNDIMEYECSDSDKENYDNSNNTNNKNKNNKNSRSTRTKITRNILQTKNSNKSAKKQISGQKRRRSA
eukprot:473224_1